MVVLFCFVVFFCGDGVVAVVVVAVAVVVVVFPSCSFGIAGVLSVERLSDKSVFIVQREKNFCSSPN